MDREWWREYKPEVLDTFSGELYGRYYEDHVDRAPVYHGSNSGAGAILIAAYFGAKNIYLLGYDCQLSAKKHWHDDHPGKLGNCDSISHWPKYFEDVKRMTPGVNIVNCSRQTALTLWPRIPLEQAL